MLMAKTLIQKHFDKYAASYDEYAVVQTQMAKTLIHTISALHSPANVLEIGCGTGTLSKMLIEAFPSAALTLNDISPRMLEQAAKRLEQYELVDQIAGDAEALCLNPVNLKLKKWDLIVSNAAFQWFNQPFSTTQSFLKHLAPGGILAFSTFGPRTFHELHHAFQLAEEQLGLQSDRRGQHFIAGSEWKKALALNGDFKWEEEVRIVHFNTVREFLYSVKKIGASNALQPRAHRQKGLSKALLKQMESSYLEHYSDEQGIRVTYHIGYGIFQKSRQTLKS